MSSPKKTSGFHSLKLSREMLQVVKELGYENPTPIQAASLPILLAGKDLIGQSSTGSGKTASFAIPILERIEIRQRETQAIVLCPTRELCTQVAREIRRLGRYSKGLHVLILSGGQPMGPQLGALEKGAHIVVGTPGRVLDHIRRKSLDLSRITTLVLDEADRMLDMGFREDIELVLEKTPSNRQTVLFSATFPKTIGELSKEFQKSPQMVKIESEAVTATTIRQVCYEIEAGQKLNAVLVLLQQRKPESAIIFCNMKNRVDELTGYLKEAGVSAEKLHGDLEQRDRDRVMAKFRNRSTQILVATDVAARGIDVEGLDVVLNFDLPAQVENYVHRIGRTGRAGKKGLAISLVEPKERFKIQAIESHTEAKMEKLKLPNEGKMPTDRLPVVELQGPAMATLYIGGGRKEKVRPGDILGALTGEAQIPASEIGKIEIHDNFSYVAISRRYAKSALDRLRIGKIKNRRFMIQLVR